MTVSSLTPWTAHAPSPLLSAIIGFARAQPTQGLGKKLAQAGARVGLALAPETIDAELYGFRARLRPRDNLSEKRAVFTPQLLDARELDYLSAFIADDFVFFDVGANFGLYALYVAVRAPVSARILAFEPQPEMRARMMTNLALNELQDRVMVESCAVSDTDGEATLYVDTRNRGETRLGDAADLTPLTVQARSSLRLSGSPAGSRCAIPMRRPGRSSISRR